MRFPERHDFREGFTLGLVTGINVTLIIIAIGRMFQ